ncbi:MAG: S9 family peptidase [Deltaproteobacteria bacterium]|nr:S9 family peptidase [Deltaproteobacteria bacterium]MBW2418712.1 S9 family peptidase [Deltaproteobacteria bacterium]
MIRIGAVALLAAAFAALLTAASAAAAPPPIEAFFRPPQFQSPRLSPNGEHVATIFYKDGHHFVLVHNLASGEMVPVGRFSDPEFLPSRLLWANDDRLLLSGDMRSRFSVGVRARTTRLMAVDRDGGNLDYLAEKWRDSGRIQIQDDILHRLPDSPKHVLLQLWRPSGPGPGVYRLNIKNGALRRVVRGQRHVHSWVADATGIVRLGWGIDPPNARVIARTNSKSDFETIADYHVTEGDGFDVLGFTEDPSIVLVAARRPRDSDPEGDRLAVYEYSLSTRKLGRLVVGHDLVDVGGPIVYRPGTNDPVAIEYWVDERELHFLDPDAELLQRRIDKSFPGRSNEILGSTRKEKVLLVDSRGPSTPPRTYLVRTEESDAFALFDEYPELQDVQLATPRPIRYSARDGLLIHGYLTLPPGSAGKELPAVLMPHGGPMARDYLAFDPHVLFLASRGYAVLQMNFRGSSGYGHAHLSAGYRRWGLEMQDDITDGAAWLVEQGIADPERIGIFGASYGGYAALMAAVKTPEVFRCAASYAGVFDLIAENRHDKQYLGGEIVEEFRGDDRKKLKAASPIHHAEQIRIPILLGHGRDDPNVHVNQSKKMAKALRKAGKNVELVLYNDEIHGYAQGTTALDFARRLEAFLAQNLGEPGVDGALSRAAAGQGDP